MIDWNSFKLDIKKYFPIKEDKSYLVKLLSNLETLEQHGKNIPFKLEEIKSSGFALKICGLYGFVAFGHMPWNYNTKEAWHAVFPYIKGKVFFGRVYRLTKEPISIILNGNVAQFRPKKLNEYEKYKAVIIGKLKHGILVDIGIHFDWGCGSIVGMVNKSSLPEKELFEELEVSQTMNLFYRGENEHKQFQFGTKPVLKEWITGEVENLTGKIVPVTIQKTEENKTGYLVHGRYNATLSTTVSIYPTNKRVVKIAKANLKKGDLIHCEVIAVDKSKRQLKLKWDFTHEIESIASRGEDFAALKQRKGKEQFRRNYIENYLDENTKKKIHIQGESNNQ